MTVTIDVASAFWYAACALGALAVLVVLWLIVSKVRNFVASLHFERSDRAALRQRWAEIEQMSRGGGEMNRKMAVLEADKLLDQALKALAMAGTTLGERLRFAQYKYPELRDVWWAHRVRNQLVHEASYHLDAGLAAKAVRAYKRALLRLGAI